MSLPATVALVGGGAKQGGKNRATYNFTSGAAGLSGRPLRCPFWTRS